MRALYVVSRTGTCISSNLLQSFHQSVSVHRSQISCMCSVFALSCVTGFCFWRSRSRYLCPHAVWECETGLSFLWVKVRCRSEKTKTTCLSWFKRQQGAPLPLPCIQRTSCRVILLTSFHFYVLYLYSYNLMCNL